MKKTAAMLAALILLTGCSRGNTSGEIQLPIYGSAAVQYEIAQAKYMDISETQSLGVTIGYPYAVYLTYPGSALVKSFNALKGRTVTAGEILAELDSSDLDYDISNQQTVVNAAYQSSLMGGRAAQLQYEIEQAKLDMMLEEKESYIIRAPFDGIITETRAAAEGSTVEEGAVCCAVSEVSKTEIYLDGGNSSLFRFGQKVQVRIDNTTYDATVVQAPDCVPAEADGNSANRAVFRLDNDAMPQVLKDSAMAVSAGWATVYVTSERSNVLAVPDAAVKSSGTENYVTLVDGEERFKLKVTVGASLGGYTEIINGISAGDVVMAEGSGEFTAAENSDEADQPPQEWDA